MSRPFITENNDTSRINLQAKHDFLSNIEMFIRFGGDTYLEFLTDFGNSLGFFPEIPRVVVRVLNDVVTPNLGELEKKISLGLRSSCDWLTIVFAHGNGDVGVFAERYLHNLAKTCYGHVRRSRSEAIGLRISRVTAAMFAFGIYWLLLVAGENDLPKEKPMENKKWLSTAVSIALAFPVQAIWKIVDKMLQARIIQLERSINVLQIFGRMIMVMRTIYRDILPGGVSASLTAEA